MVDLEVLDAMGSTQERLKEIFTAQPPPSIAEWEKLQALPEDKRQQAFDSMEPAKRQAMSQAVKDRAAYPEGLLEKIERDIKLRNQFEGEINRRFSEQINWSLRNYQMYSAVDYAWDAPPINKETYPLLLYAQGKLDLGSCGKKISDLPCVDKYAVRDAKGEIVGVDLPKFFEVNFNLVRSVISRRHAAQVNKYSSLYPHYKYEPRSTTTVAKLRADVVSQIMDIMTDNFDLRHHDADVIRDAMLYGHSVDFIRSRWERERQQVFDPDIAPDLRTKENPRFKSVVTKEGLSFVNPHPSRVFWDNSCPMASINSDEGPEFIGFWDVVRYGDIVKNPKYWNRTTISYSATIVQLFSTYAQYFSQYYCTITPPCGTNTLDLTSQNDRLNNQGLYAQAQEDASMIIAYYYRKIIPKDWGIGDYPYPVWLRMIVAGDKTVVYAEFLPSTPAVYCGINERDSRQLNISIGMELLPYQDQMTQLLSLLLYTVQATNFRVLAIDTDVCEPENLKQFRAQASAQNRYQTCMVFEYSGTKYREMGVNPQQILSLVQTNAGAAITQIFQCMTQLIQLAERLMALSPHELGQPAPREISATETNMMAGTTETIYGFISDAIDEFRAAKKRLLYESYMVCGDPNFTAPVVNRYTRKTIEKAGLKLVEEDIETYPSDDEPKTHTVMGTKSALLASYIFTSRDGSLRSVNTQSANVLTQLLAVVQNPAVMQALGKEKYYEIVNEIFRLSGAGVDLKLEVKEGESDSLGVDMNQQVQNVLSQLTSEAESSKQAIDKLSQEVGQLLGIVQQLTEQVKELDRRPNAPAVDPIKYAQGRMKMNMDRQKMRHAEEAHAMDMGLKGLKAMSGMPGNVGNTWSQTSV